MGIFVTSNENVEFLAALAVAFCVAVIISGFDLYWYVSQRNIKTISMFRCFVIWCFIGANGIISGFLFFLTCKYPGSWFHNVIGQQQENSFLRAVAVGLSFMVIIRSQLGNYNSENGAGIDAIYATLRKLTIRRWKTLSTRRFRQIAASYSVRVCASLHRDDILRGLREHCLQRIDTLYDDDAQRTESAKKEYLQVVKGEEDIVRPLEEQVAKMIEWSFAFAGLGEERICLDDRLKRADRPTGNINI